MRRGQGEPLPHVQACVVGHPLTVFACGRALLFLFFPPHFFAEGEKMWRERMCLFHAAAGEKACPVRLRSGQALSVVEGTLGSRDCVRPFV